MKELKEVNLIFNDCYKLYKKFITTELLDDDIAQLIEEATQLSKKHNCTFATDILLAVVDEIDRVEAGMHGRKKITPSQIIIAVHETQERK